MSNDKIREFLKELVEFLQKVIEWLEGEYESFLNFYNEYTKRFGEDSFAKFIKEEVDHKKLAYLKVISRAVSRGSYDTVIPLVLSFSGFCDTAVLYLACSSLSNRISRLEDIVSKKLPELRAEIEQIKSNFNGFINAIKAEIEARKKSLKDLNYIR